jgi:hypothetical protein
MVLHRVAHGFAFYILTCTVHRFQVSPNYTPMCGGIPLWASFRIDDNEMNEPRSSLFHFGTSACPKSNYCPSEMLLLGRCETFCNGFAYQHLTRMSIAF